MANSLLFLQDKNMEQDHQEIGQLSKIKKKFFIIFFQEVLNYKELKQLLLKALKEFIEAISVAWEYYHCNFYLARMLIL